MTPMKLMRFFRIVVLGLCLVAAGGLRAEAPKLVVAILVDQLRADYLDRFREHFGEGGFRLLMEQGAWMTSARYNYAPTLTAPGHASFLSGATPATHGIIGNDWFDKSSGKSVYCCEDRSVNGVGTDSPAGQMSPRRFVGATMADQMRLRYRSKVIGLSLKDRGAILPAGGKPAGAYWFESASGRFVTSSYYRSELPAWVERFNAAGRAQGYVGRVWERALPESAYERPESGPLKFPHPVEVSARGGYEALASSPFGNELVRQFAEAAVEGEKLGSASEPDLLTVSFSCVDYVGHRFGPYSQEVQDMVVRLDRELAGFFRFLDAKVGLKKTLLVLTADHGVAPVPEFAQAEGLGGGRLDEFALMGDLLGRLEERFGAGSYLLNRKIFNGHLYFNHEVLRQKQIEAQTLARFIREWALSTGLFHHAFWREDLLAGLAPGLVGQAILQGYHPERGGDVVLVPKPFVIPSAQASGTTHGSPFSYDTHIPVLFWGAPIRPGRYADEFWITDIVPTLSEVLRIETPPGCVGKPFVRALQP
ncbi:MAG: hypothetical protein RLZZ142_989 [Verrucomicrobiota bacterium]